MMNQKQLEHLYRHITKYKGVAMLCQYNKGKSNNNLSTKRYVGISKYAIYGNDYHLDVFGYEHELPSMIMKHVGNCIHEVQDTMPELVLSPMGVPLQLFDIRNPDHKIRNKQYNYYFEKFVHPLKTRTVTDEERLWLEQCALKYQSPGDMMQTKSGGITDFSQSKVIDF